MAVSAAASAYSGNKAADAAKDGAKMSADTQRYMYDTSRADTAPYRQVGASALNQLAALYGLPQYREEAPAPAAPAVNLADVVQQSMTNRPKVGGGRYGGALNTPAKLAALEASRAARSALAAQPQAPAPAANDPAPIEGDYIPAAAPDYSAFYNSPDYKFAYDEGMRATEQGLSRQGLTGSGAALKALTRFGQGLASQQLSNYKNSLAALAGIGQTSTAQMGSLGLATGQGIGAAMQNAGDARASGYLNTGSAISNVANNYGQYQLLKAGGYLGGGASTPPPSYLNYNQGMA